jgi:hypothetical protein
LDVAPGAVRRTPAARGVQGAAAGRIGDALEVA